MTAELLYYKNDTPFSEFLLVGSDEPCKLILLNGVCREIYRY